MSFLAKLRDSIQEKAASEPIECPRGWGQVLFPLNLSAFWPYFWIGRACPISGAESCAECEYPPNPDAFRLEEHLRKLDELQHTGTLSAREHEQRRSALIALHPTPEAGEGYRIAAWVLGPLGILWAAVGMPLALNYHPGFWGLAGLGAIQLALWCTFAGLARRKTAPAERADS